MENFSKMKFAALMMAAGLMTVSCSQNDDVVPDAGGQATEKAFTVTISGGDAKTGTRAPGTPASVTGVGDEQKVNDAWLVFAKTALAPQGYKAYVSHEVGGGAADGNGMNDICEVRGAASDSQFYVIANIDAANVTAADGTPITWATFIARTDITEAEIKGLIEKQTKSKINGFNTGIKANPTAPTFAANARMLMTGSASTGNDTENIVQIAVDIKREYAKVDLAVNHTLGATIEATGATLNTIYDEMAIRRVATRISPFTQQTGDWYSPRPYVKDEGDNNTMTAGASEFRFTQSYNTPGVVGATNALGHFYVTPNYSIVKDYSTAVLVKVNMTADFDRDPDTPMTTEDRWFRAIIADANFPEAGDLYKTAKNTYYKITGTINSIGSESEDVALTDDVDMDITVRIADWSVRDVNVDFE